MRTIEITDIRKKRHTIVVESIDSFRELDMDEVHGLAEGTKIVYHSGNTSIAVITGMPYGMIETKVHGYYLHEESDSPGIQALIKERKEYEAKTNRHVGPEQHVVLTEDIPVEQERHEQEFGD